MDPPAKEGPLLVQHSYKFGTKRWKRSWFVLYPASQHGVARLEFFDCKEPALPAERLGTRRLDKTVVRLADCTSVGPVPESGPRAGTAVFRLETSGRSYLLAAEKQQSEEWVAKLCEIAFPGNSPGDAGVAARHGKEGGREVPALEMAVNSIYYSRDEVNAFWVTVQRTEAAERCELRGTYVLKAERDSLVLKDPRTNGILYVWPYRLLRRYGRDKVMFSFEAGRRCDSGPGNFTFETKQGNEIFRLVEASIREQKAQVEENRQSCDSLDSDSPGVVLIHQALADSLSLELPAEGDDTVAPKAGLAPRPSAAAEERDAVSMLKTRTLPELPVPQAKPTVSSTPPRSPLPKVPHTVLPAEDLSSVYSEPLDSVKGFRPWPDSLYSDPVDSKPAGGARAPGGASDELKLRPLVPLYSGTYKQVRAEERSQPPAVPRQREHIYDEPEGCASRLLPSTTCIYDEARPMGEAWRTQGHDGRSGYEYPYNPSTDDYSVPAFQAKAKGPKPVPAPKPQAALIPKGAERSRDPGKRWGNAAPEKAAVKPRLNSSNNNNNVEVLYSQVAKPQHMQKKEQSVDECSLSPVYEDLGEI
ncbi:docking protein 1 isoform X1 [Falco biarmicus]|uniref:docking protein 1 isoform X1 n=1 Tax=Falco rusticolus TaxID=120794 RepID=UPI0018869C48|nr:docking protein 1 isoform X1 [Falco rusticolus]XP_055557000.1 docking protein 1 isoform X1 [Falco cherrug]XP_056201963.1 docking protein 1 isoform X1 [Falco biarmicus]